MAKHKVFSAYDQKLQIWMQPMFFLHSGQAERTWSELCNNRDSILAKHPGDFALYQIGEFDDATSQLNSILPPVLLMSAIQAKEPPADPAPLLARQN